MLGSITTDVDKGGNNLAWPDIRLICLIVEDSIIVLNRYYLKSNTPRRLENFEPVEIDYVTHFHSF